MDLNLFVKILIAALLVESIWETIRMILNSADEGKKQFIAKLGSLVIGLLVAFNYNLDLPELAGLDNHYRIIGIGITGILISRGSQFIHDLLTQLQLNNTLVKDNKILDEGNLDLKIINKDLKNIHEELKNDLYPPINKS